MKSEREKLQARKLTFATAAAFTQRKRDKMTEGKGSGGGEQKRMPGWRKIANIVENDVSSSFGKQGTFSVVRTHPD
jgi:hypothetical protein